MIDTVIPQTISAWMQTLLSNLCTIIVIAIGSPFFLIVLVPLSAIYYFVQVTVVVVTVVVTLVTVVVVTATIVYAIAIISFL